MAKCPFAVQQIIPESGQQGRINPTTLIFHEAVSSADSLRDYWNSPGVELESHFYISSTGTIYQYMDTNVRADANVDANGFAISVETWDNSNRDPLLGWNSAMLAAAKRLAAWVCDVHDVKAAPATTWNGGGIGGHNWFPQPWARGPRQCPGVTRNAQIRNDIIPYVAGGGGWGNPQQEDNMAGSDDFSDPEEDRVLAAAGKQLDDYRVTDGGPGDVRPDDYPLDRPDDQLGHVMTMRAWQQRHIGLSKSMNNGVARVETVANGNAAALVRVEASLARIEAALTSLAVGGQTQEGFDALFRTSSLTPGLLREGAVFVDNDPPHPPSGG